MTVRQNAMGALFGKKHQTREAHRRVDEVLEFVGLSEMAISSSATSRSSTRSGSRWRALATQPRLLMLDEMAGLNPTEVQGAMDLVRKIRDSGATNVMIEHVAHAIMNICDRSSSCTTGEDRETPRRFRPARRSSKCIGEMTQ